MEQIAPVSPSRNPRPVTPNPGRRPGLAALLAVCWLGATGVGAVEEPDEATVLQRFGEPDAGHQAPSPWDDAGFVVDPDAVLVFTGQANMVRHQRDGRMEATLLLARHEQRPRVRFMAWEADTVYEQWRELNFGSWQGQLQAVGAGVALLQYGQLEALDGADSLAGFVSAYHHLVDQYMQVTPRLVLISPTPFEAAPPDRPHAPSMDSHNAALELYVGAIRDIARQRGLLFVDLFHPLLEHAHTGDAAPDSPRLTDNGLHLNRHGLDLVARQLALQLGIDDPGAPDDALLGLIAEKNRLWFDCWRPANWSFVYGDRITQLFATAIDDEPSLREVFEQHQPLIADLDRRVLELAAGGADPGPSVEPAAVPDSDPSLIPTVEEQLAAFTVADGFEVELVADDSMGVVKPTHMAWDHHGRLYIACSPTYPHNLPGVEPADYVWVGEDRSGDGRIDHWGRLIEGLTMVHGVVPGDGGVYVCDFDRLLHVRDTNGDGVGDSVRVVLHGFGIGDTHQVINSIAWDHGGRLWFTQGLHAFSRVETPHGIARLHQAGVWRLNPRTLRLDGFFNGAKAGHNGWGVAFDDFGQVFHKSGDRPAGYYSTPGLVAIQDPTEYHPTGALFDTQPKTSAIELVGSGALPEAWQGGALISGYMGHLIEIHRIFDDGAGFASEQLPRPLVSEHSAFRPVGTSVGPDGAVYIADWVNPLIGHYQHSYADPRRDRSHGRIWRLRATDSEPSTPPDLDSMAPAELAAQLGATERWVREQARRLLFAAPTGEVLAALEQQDDANGTDERLWIEWMGVREAHESTCPDLWTRMLTATDPRVRAYGVRVAGMWHAQLGGQASLDAIAAAAADPHPRVRLEAVVAAAAINDPAAARAILPVFGRERDRFINYALEQNVRALRPHWQELLRDEPAEASDLLAGGAGEFLRQRLQPPPPPHPGQVIYASLCSNCHQPEGGGLAGVYPALTGSPWLAADQTDALVKITLQGLATPADDLPDGRAALPMPPMGLTDEQAAAVLSYIRGRFGNDESGGDVTPGQVREVRDRHDDRTGFWTPAELAAP